MEFLHARPIRTPATEQSLMTVRQRRMLGLSRFHLSSLMYRLFVGSELTSVCEGEFSFRMSEMHARDMVALFKEPHRSGRHILDEFPWWQMTPYLIHASSLFFVSEIYPQYIGATFVQGKYRPRPEEARASAEECLELLEGLQVGQVGSAEVERAARLLRGLSAKYSRTGRIEPASSSRRDVVAVGASDEWSPEFSSAMAWIMHFYAPSPIPTRSTVPDSSDIQIA